METVAVVVASIALGFTVFGFWWTHWWMHWRRGRVLVGTPRSFAACCKGENDLLLIQLPLVFYNAGAAAQVVQNLRLTLQQDNKKSDVLYYNNTVPDLASQERQWAKQFAIAGRASYSCILAFQRNPGRLTFSAGTCTGTLDAKLNEERVWRALLTFSLRTPESALATLNSERLIAYDNDPDRE